MDKQEIISKIKNMYIMLLYAISKEDINRVKQYLSTDLLERYNNMIKDNINNNVIQKYGELNVASVDIISETEGMIIANIVVKYIDFKIDRDSKKYVEGEKTRSKRNVTLRVKCLEENKELLYRCRNCGAPLNINLTSVCTYCGQPVDINDSPYVIESIEVQ